MIDKEKLKTMPKVILYCAIMLAIWPIGAYLMWRDKQIDKQLKVPEIICCFVLWIILLFSLYEKYIVYQEDMEVQSQQEDIIQMQTPVSKVTITPPVITETSIPTKEPKLDSTKKPKVTKKPIKKKKSHRKGMYGISNKDIHDIDAAFRADKVRNDVTGNWRISTIAANVELEKYALSYYKWVFSDDNEIHGIVNFNNKTTTKISVLGKLLDVTVYEYVSGEEHDAELLFSGILLNEYLVYKDNGDIEKIQ